MMKMLIDNWYLIIACVVVGVVAGVKIKGWFTQPTSDQVKNIKEWLLYAVTEAEIALGGKTGQLKLRMVYDMAIEKFEWLSFISFELFTEWVDEALVNMRDMLAKNETISEIVKGEK